VRSTSTTKLPTSSTRMARRQELWSGRRRISGDQAHGATREAESGAAATVTCPEGLDRRGTERTPDRPPDASSTPSGMPTQDPRAGQERAGRRPLAPELSAMSRLARSRRVQDRDGVACRLQPPNVRHQPQRWRHCARCRLHAMLDLVFAFACRCQCASDGLSGAFPRL